MEYQQEFSDFLTKYHATEMDPEEMGAFMARLAQIYAGYNLKLAAAHKSLAIVSRDIASRVEENGKSITSAKAETFIAATDEADLYNSLKANIQNIEQFISSVRALQKGALKEYNYMGNT